MSKLIVIWLLTFSGFVFNSRQPQATDPIIGTWKGTSICQVKDSPCHDEIAICHAIKIPGQKIYKFQMNKIVNGQEVEMGPLNFIYNESKQTLMAESPGARGRGTWNFKITGKTIHGTLTIGNDVLYRVINLQKAD
jgi:hypothetical protein